MSDPSELLRRVLVDVADETPLLLTAPESVRASAADARRRERRRTTLVAGAVAAVVLVLLPLVWPDGREDGADPAAGPSSSAPPVPSDDAGHPTRGSGLGTLPLGDPPRVPWLDGDVLVAPDGARTPLRLGRASSAVPVGDGVLVTDGLWFEGTTGLTRWEAGEGVDRWATTGPATTSALGDVAWATVHPPETVTPGHHAVWVWSDGDVAEFPIGQASPMPVVVGFVGRSVVWSGWGYGEGHVTVLDPGRGDRPLTTLGSAVDTDERAGRIAGQAAGDPWTGRVVDAASGRVVQDFPQLDLLALSPDGSLVLATSSQRPGRLTAYEVDGGAQVGVLLDGRRGAGPAIGWGDLVWEDDSHVLVEAIDDDAGALVRAGLDGTLERATRVGLWDGAEIAQP